MGFVTPRTMALTTTSSSSARAGVKVLMLEAGRNDDFRTETPMFQTSADAPLRGAGTPDKPVRIFVCEAQHDPESTAHFRNIKGRELP